MSERQIIRLPPPPVALSLLKTQSGSRPILSATCHHKLGYNPSTGNIMMTSAATGRPCSVVRALTEPGRLARSEALGIRVDAGSGPALGLAVAAAAGPGSVTV